MGADMMLLKAVLIVLSAALSAAILSIYRPCNLNNGACIQNSLRSKSRCQPPRGSAPPVYRVPRSRFDAPAFNASYDAIDMVIRGLDRCFVSEYYINQKSSSRLLAIDCPWLTFESSRVMYQHYLRREDGVFRYYINGSYPMITVNVPMSEEPYLNMCRDYANIYVHQLPIFTISPLDRPTKNHLTRNLADLRVFEREAFAARAQLLARVIVNNKLCNFGC